MVLFRDWMHFLTAARPTLDLKALGFVLCLDPGETTGWALFHEGRLHSCGQEVTGQNPALMAEFVESVLDTEWEEVDGRSSFMSRIVYEEYRVRGNKFKEHVGSEVVTIQHIGAIKVVADRYGVDLWKQSAALAKTFATDALLRRLGLYQTGMRHANDAIRHGVRYHLFVAGRSRGSSTS